MFCLFLCFLFPCAPRLHSLWRRDSILPDLEACSERHTDEQYSKQSELIFQGNWRTQKFEGCPPACSVPIHRHTTTATFSRRFRQETFIFTPCLSSKASTQPTWYSMYQPQPLMHQFCVSYHSTEDASAPGNVTEFQQEAPFLGVPAWPEHQITVTFQRGQKSCC